MTDETPQYPPYPETETEHFDQISPLEGTQEQPDGSLAPANPVRPAETPADEFMAPVEVVAPAVPVQYTAEFQDSVAEQLAQQRAQLAQPAGNVDIHGAPHFMRVADGVELCGQCGEEWPCEGWKRMAAAGEAGRAFGPTTLDQPVSRLPTFEQAAAAAGLTPEELVRLYTSRGL